VANPGASFNVCRGFLYETHGTIFHGKRSSPGLIVHVIACLAEGLGIRGTARVFEIDANAMLSRPIFYMICISTRSSLTNSMPPSVR
jgi:hypothetical protein